MSPYLIALLSLHDALPISPGPGRRPPGAGRARGRLHPRVRRARGERLHRAEPVKPDAPMPAPSVPDLGTWRKARSEEHTSELQSPDQLVCRLLLEKKNQRK